MYSIKSENQHISLFPSYSSLKVHQKLKTSAVFNSNFELKSKSMTCILHFPELF